MKAALALWSVSEELVAGSKIAMIFESLISDGVSEPDEILKELSIIRCHCLDPEDAVKIVLKGIDIRRKRRVRRS